MGNDDYSDDEELLDGNEAPEYIAKVLPKGSKAWRSIERYREMKELRKRLEDLLSEDFADDLNDLRW